MNRQEKTGMTHSGAELPTILCSRLAKQEAETAQKATLIVTISKYSLEKIKQFYNVDEAKFGLFQTELTQKNSSPLPDREAAKRQFGLGNEPCVLFVGSLIPPERVAFSD